MKKIKALLVSIIVGLSGFAKGHAATQKKQNNRSRPNIFKRWYRNASESSTNMLTGVKATMQGTGNTLEAVKDTAKKIEETSKKLDGTIKKANLFFDGSHEKLGQINNAIQGTLKNINCTTKEAQETLSTMQELTKQTQGTLAKFDNLVILLQVLVVVATIKLIVSLFTERITKKKSKVKRINQE